MKKNKLNLILSLVAISSAVVATTCLTSCSFNDFKNVINNQKPAIVPNKPVETINFANLNSLTKNYDNSLNIASKTYKENFCNTSIDSEFNWPSFNSFLPKNLNKEIVFTNNEFQKGMNEFNKKGNADTLTVMYPVLLSLNESLITTAFYGLAIESLNFYNWVQIHDNVPSCHIIKENYLLPVPQESTSYNVLLMNAYNVSSDYFKKTIQIAYLIYTEQNVSDKFNNLYEYGEIMSNAVHSNIKMMNTDVPSNFESTKTMTFWQFYNGDDNNPTLNEQLKNGYSKAIQFSSFNLKEFNILEIKQWFDSTKGEN